MLHFYHITDRASATFYDASNCVCKWLNRWEIKTIYPNKRHSNQNRHRAVTSRSTWSAWRQWWLERWTWTLIHWFFCRCQTRVSSVCTECGTSFLYRQTVHIITSWLGNVTDLWSRGCGFNSQSGRIKWLLLGCGQTNHLGIKPMPSLPSFVNRKSIVNRESACLHVVVKVEWVHTCQVASTRNLS